MREVVMALLEELRSAIRSLTGPGWRADDLTPENWRARPMLFVWRSAAEACGLRESASGRLPARSLTAGSETVTVHFAELRGADAATEIRIAVAGAPREGPRLYPESPSTLIQKRQGVVEVELGDEVFDDQFFIGGEPAELFARLDADTRRDLLAVNRRSNLYLARGELRVSCAEARLGSPLKTFLAQLIRVSQRLFGPLDIATALAKNARAESAGVRLQNLLVLNREYPGDERTLAALRSALGDAVPEIRLRAAQALGEEGSATLVQLAADEEIADECSAAAVAALGSRLEQARLETVLAASLGRGRLETVLACVTVLGDRSDERAAALLVELVRRSSYRVPAAAARALARANAPGSEAALIEALASDSDDLRLAAVEGLGEIGSAAAVMPLREVKGSRELQRAVRQAVARIQSRAAGASPGQLSLAAAAAGQVSLAPAESGGLSFPPAAAGAVSLGSAMPDAATSDNAGRSGSA